MEKEEYERAVRTAKRGIYHTVYSCPDCEDGIEHTRHGCVVDCGVCGKSHTEWCPIGEKEGTVLRWILECSCGTTAFIKVN